MPRNSWLTQEKFHFFFILLIFYLFNLLFNFVGFCLFVLLLKKRERVYREVRGISQEKGRHDQNVLHIIFKIKMYLFLRYYR